MSEKIMNEIIQERKRQDKKWGMQRHPTSKWLAILGEEFGESCKAYLELNKKELRNELIQVAAVTIAFIENLDN